MCPIWPLHFIVMYLLALAPLFVLCRSLPQLVATFKPTAFEATMDTYDEIYMTLSGLEDGMNNLEVEIMSGNEDIASIDNNVYTLNMDVIQPPTWTTALRLNANFIGKTEVSVVVRDKVTQERKTATNVLPVTVMRPQRVIDRVFVICVATFVSLIFINFGCAVDFEVAKAVLKKPIGPAIGMFGQFFIMPMTSYLLGLAIFPENPEMRLGLFFTGVAPGGGASNIWTLILNGNINLSLAMTSISTIASFGFIPLWVFSLGATIFAQANLGVPYRRIATFVIGLLVPLAIGLGMQKWTPRVARFMVRILKGFSSLLLVFIIVFAIATNLYIFKLFTWQIYVAGMGLPWIGYMLGYILARIARQPHADAMAISIETGVQNTGIAIFLLQFALSQPEADLTTVVPVSVAIMTPVPMTAIYVYQKISSCIRDKKNKHVKMTDDVSTPLEGTPELTVATIEGGLGKNIRKDIE